MNSYYRVLQVPNDIDQVIKQALLDDLRLLVNSAVILIFDKQRDEASSKRIKSLDTKKEGLYTRINK